MPRARSVLVVEGIAIVEAIVLTGLLGFLTRYYVGKKLVQLVDYVILNVPLLGKIYGTVKQVNQAFTSEKKSSSSRW